MKYAILAVYLLIGIGSILFFDWLIGVDSSVIIRATIAGYIGGAVGMWWVQERIKADEEG